MEIKKIYIPIDFSFSMNKSVTETHLKKIIGERPKRKWVIKRVDAYKDGAIKLSKKGFQVFEELID